MSRPIEDYALISNSRTAALVGSDGSIDWLCLPRYDSGSTFGALLGDESHGQWLLRPTDPDATVERHYDADSFTLISHWTTTDGEVEVTDVMPIDDDGERIDVVRCVRGLRGHVPMRQELRIRFDYATALPWVRQVQENGRPALVAYAGPDALIVRGPRLHAQDHAHVSEFRVRPGEFLPIQLSWFPSHREAPEPLDVEDAIASTSAWWAEWSRDPDFAGAYDEQVLRSLLTLRALTHQGTGGIVAAVTTSLPEQFGGERNWDYRYVWLRDAALTLQALVAHGYVAEGEHWRDWLLRAIAGDPNDLQIMYGLAGERYLPERELTSLPGYEGAAPVRVGNAAVDQYQADAIGHVMVALHAVRASGVDDTEFSWPLQRSLMGYLERNWERPDQGMWEVRGPARHFTHSRVMIWAALDRAVKAVRDFGLKGPADRWEKLRDTLKDEIDRNGYDAARGSFVQYYGGTEIDASLLLLTEVGFCEADDPRMLGTVALIEKELMSGGLVHRYRTQRGVDGLPPGEFPFVACSFWLVRQYAQSGRLDDARKLMDRMLGFCNDVGLLAEEVDPDTGRHAGNFPQAFSHLALVWAADAIGSAERADRDPEAASGGV